MEREKEVSGEGNARGERTVGVCIGWFGSILYIIE